MGDDFDSILLYLKSNDIDIKGILCLGELKQKTYAGIPFISVKELKNQNTENMFVVVTDPELFYVDRRRQVVRRLVREKKRAELIKTLHQCGIQRYYFLRKPDIADIYVFPDHNLYNGRMHYYKQHLYELKQTYEMLSDDLSKETMVEFVRVYLQSGWYRLDECDGRNKYFAGQGRGKDMEQLYEHKEDEVWVNCGSSIGDSILLYLSEGYKAKKIYAFEGSKKIYGMLCKNLQQLPEKLNTEIIPVNEFISEETNWNNTIQEKVTLINADIEGAELELLHTMEGRIKADRPVLAICVYHHNTDLVEIPKFIGKTVNNYKYVLRKYACGVGNTMRTSELVLYAIPEERYLLHNSRGKRIVRQ